MKHIYSIRAGCRRCVGHPMLRTVLATLAIGMMLVACGGGGGGGGNVRPDSMPTPPGSGAGGAEPAPRSGNLQAVLDKATAVEFGGGGSIRSADGSRYEEALLFYRSCRLTTGRTCRADLTQSVEIGEERGSISISLDLVEAHPSPRQVTQHNGMQIIDPAIRVKADVRDLAVGGGYASFAAAAGDYMVFGIGRTNPEPGLGTLEYSSFAYVVGPAPSVLVHK